MKRYLTLAGWLVLGAMSLQAQTLSAFKSGEDVSKLALSSKLWDKIKSDTVIVYPQTTVIMNDKTANEVSANMSAKSLHVKSVCDGKNVAFLIEWSDTTKNVQERRDSNTYGDGFAVQFATTKGALPYIGMGSEGRAVIVHLQKVTGALYEPNNAQDVFHQVNVSNQNAFGKDAKAYQEAVAKQGNGDYQRTFIAEGFRSMTQIRDASESSVMEMNYAKGTWKALLIRPLQSTYLSLSGSTPVAFAVWDGALHHRDGLKRLSAWVELNLDGNRMLNPAFAETIGDVKNGENVVMENCASCHQYKEVKNAPEFMAPNLSNIGGYGNDSYLKESIVEPNGVVVPGYNLNAHRNFAWYTLDDKGVRSSTMPPFSHLDEKSINDAVAFLKTLKAEVK